MGLVGDKKPFEDVGVGGVIDKVDNGLKGFEDVGGVCDIRLPTGTRLIDRREPLIPRSSTSDSKFVLEEFEEG